MRKTVQTNLIPMIVFLIFTLASGFLAGTAAFIAAKVVKVSTF